MTFLWLGASGIHSIFDALEVETGSERSWPRKRALALGTCVLLSIGVALLALLGPGLEAVLVAFGRAMPWLASVSSQWTRAVVGLAVLFGQVCLLYWIGVPPAARHRMPLVPGAAVAVLLQTGMAFGYAQYLRHLGGGPLYSAGLAVIGGALMALYLYCLALLTGAAVNRQLSRSRPVGQ